MKRLGRFVAVTGLLMAALGLGLWPSFSGAQQPSPTGTVPPGIIVKSPAESDLQVGIHVGPGPFIAGRTVERDFITLSINKQAAIYLLLINPEEEVTTGGTTFTVRKVRLLFPNRDFRGNFLQKGAYKFPGPGLWERPFEISGPPGTAYVQVIATPVPIGLELHAFEEPFPALGITPELVKQEIERRIQQKGLLPADWAASWTQYEVLRSEHLSPQRVGSLLVRVLDKGTGAGLAGAQIFVDRIPRERLTDDDGLVTVPNLSVGQHTVTATRRGYRDATKTVNIEEKPDNIVVFELEPLPRKAALTANPTWVGSPVQPITFDASASTPRDSIILYIWDFQSDWRPDRFTKEPRVTITPGEAGLATGPNLVTIIIVFEDATIDSASVKIYAEGPILPMVPGEPGTSVISGERGEVNPITLSIVKGNVAFVVFHSSYHWGRQLGQLQVGKDAQGKWPPVTLTFDYNFWALPIRDGVKSFVRFRFYRFNITANRWECVKPDGTIEPDLTKCDGTRDRYIVPLPAADRVGTWIQDHKHENIRFPDAAICVIVTVELEVPTASRASEPVKIEYRNIRLRS